ncbi:DUF4238 domain-containing protein [Parasedimentitalea huanghaiensis]|uniref:DUF4238 domain-containing protein n=1 Tax=Parasedimentitalea huanghaiensis TaxID=2682100 RepID=A0A6L6WIJ1_9RHOB|nr:DUF4238 domain-containing protein [Zongyanglinia huanghaiensis]MVO17141.1 DUF4238 domain-containing protein [Zongyanglinia huanghaiensis]
MTQQVSKRHHFIPVSILKNFCISGESTLYTRRADNGLPGRRNINRIFFRWHYNSFELVDGRKDDQVEKFFARELDNFIPEWQVAFEQAAKGDNKILFSSKQSRYRFIQFFYNHMKRTPDLTAPLVEEVKSEVFSRDLESEFEKRHRPLTEQEKKLLEQDEFRDRAAANSRVSNFGKQSENILNRLAAMRIFVATPQRVSKQFIVASNPVVRFEDYPLQELGTPGVELWTTISPKIAVGFAHYDKTDNLQTDLLRLDDRSVRQLNQSLARRSHAIAGKSQALLESLKKAAW